MDDLRREFADRRRCRCQSSHRHMYRMQKPNTSAFPVVLNQPHYNSIEKGGFVGQTSRKLTSSLPRLRCHAAAAGIRSSKDVNESAFQLSVSQLVLVEPRTVALRYSPDLGPQPEVITACSCLQCQPCNQVGGLVECGTLRIAGPREQPDMQGEHQYQAQSSPSSR